MSATREQLEQTIISYFRSRDDTLVSYQGLGTYRIALTTTTARQHFGTNRNEIDITFNSDMVSPISGELITIMHPFLEVIRNDLGSDDRKNPRLAEAHGVLNLLDPTGPIMIPNIVFPPEVLDHSSLEVTHEYIPTFVLSYHILYNSDERSENIVRLCYDAVSGQLQQHLIPDLADMLLIDGAPPQANGQPPLPLDQILNLAQAEIEGLVRADLADFVGHIESRLSKERESLQSYYHAELHNIEKEERDRRFENSEARRQLKDRVEKNLQELEQKSTCEVRIQLLSVLLVWCPLVSYSMVVSSVRRRLVLEEARYDSRDGQLTFKQCPDCGNRTTFDLCLVGQHITCASCSDRSDRCSVCQDSVCSNHSEDCYDCSELICVEDQSKCSYGKHSLDAIFCPRCLVKSFEQQPLCKHCLTNCPLCQRDFAHEHIGICCVGGEPVCIVKTAEPCGRLCIECNRVVCTTHGRMTVERSWTCENHSARSECCDQWYPLRRLMRCCAGDELLCPTHQVICAHCHSPVCFNHSSELQGRQEQRVCALHRSTCQSCPTSYSYLTSDLVVCTTCGDTCCAEHHGRCTECREPVCFRHSIISAAGEILCARHSGLCRRCPDTRNIHRIKALSNCVQCNTYVCVDHRLTCEVCQRTHLCQVHKADLKACPGCGRRSCGSAGCGPETQRCDICAMAYCVQCVQPSTAPNCPTCQKLEITAFGPIDDQWLSRLEKVQSILPQNAAETLKTILSASPNITFKYEQNMIYTIILVKPRATFMQKVRILDFALSRRQLRLIVRKDGVLLLAHVEHADS